MTHGLEIGVKLRLSLWTVMPLVLAAAAAAATAGDDVPRPGAKAHYDGRHARRLPNTPAHEFGSVEAGVDRVGADELAALNPQPLDDRGERAELKLTYAGSQPLPAVHVDGAATRIHTQGLFRTERFAYVTGRLEARPRRPVLVRFDLQDLKTVEVVTLGPRAESQDHPGGFDCDGQSLWIPIAESRRHSTTTIVRFPFAPDQPLATGRTAAAFEVDDHIGALAVDRATGRLYGANWDTLVIYVWTRDGSLVEKIPREQLVAGLPQWALAVQDWKSLGSGRILAGGIDKSAARDPAQSQAVVAVLNVPQRNSEAEVRLPPVPGYHGTPTHEGLAHDGEHVWLVPADLNAGATLYRYEAAGLPVQSRH